jgi:ketosteroid isomerase-like protein
MPLSNEDLVFQYFKLIENKDIDGMLDLFDYDAVVTEPFSKSKELRGKASIEPFFKVAAMANSGLDRKIEIEKSANGRTAPDRLVALVTFEKGDRTKGRFTFGFARNDGARKIKSLHIKFL